jgi:YjjG family noncanonical pyrimidine nucleotidase
MYDHIFFDADGTLFDFMAAERWAISRVLEDIGIEASDEAIDTYSRINNGVWLEFEQGSITLGRLKTERFCRLYDRYGISGDPSVSADRYAQLLAQTPHLYDDAIEVLDCLRNAGMPMSMITNGISAVQRGRLRATGTEGYFKTIVISEEIGVQKPDPRYFEQALGMVRATGAPSQRPLVVGDSPSSDIRGGIGAGLDTCWINRFGMQVDPGAVPTFEIATLRQLPPLLGLAH